MFRRFALYRQRSGYVTHAPNAAGDFGLTPAFRSALRFYTRAGAERFKARHAAALRGGWRVERAPRSHFAAALARFLGRA